MNRKYFRLLTVVAVLLVVNFVTLPAAHARSLSGSHATIHGTTDVWSAALAWIANLLPGGHTSPSATLRHLTSRDLTGGIFRTNTGSCLDPNGIPRCTGI